MGVKQPQQELTLMTVQPMRHFRWQRLLASGLVALGLLATPACSTGSSGDKAATETGSNNSGSRDEGSLLRWKSCSIAERAECATLKVPLDWSDPDGTKIDLALGRIRATGEFSGSLVMNPGGPGGSGLELLAGHPTTAAIAERFDRVSWDPRGVGRSAGLDCGSAISDLLTLDSDPDTPAEQADLDKAARAVSDDCAKTDPALLRHMRTQDTARDLEAIRVALGDKPLNYLGFSYGTHIGQVYAALFPNKVAKLVLDGIVDPAESFTEFLLTQTAAFDAAFERQVAECKRAGALECGVKDLAKAYDTVKERSEQKRLPAGSETVGPAEVAIATITTTYAPDGWMDLGPALQEALDGDASTLRMISDSYQDMASYAPYAAVICSDGPTPRGTDAYRAFADQARLVSPRFGGAVANELLPCATWPVDTPDEPDLKITGIPPILLIANSGDAATPIENAVRVHERIDKSVLVTVDSEGHTSFGDNSCVDKIVEDYLLRSKVPSGGSAKCQ